MKKSRLKLMNVRGSALISALAVVAMTSLLMSGVCVLASSHEVRQNRDAQYELALQVAEAGINYELNCSANGTCTGNSGNADLAASPQTGSVSGVSGTYSVYADAVTPNTITSTGTVGSGSSAISRTIQVNVSGSSVFNGQYAVFGTKTVTVPSTSTITGTIGSNATVTGTPSSGSSCTIKSSCRDNYDTVDNICNKQFPSGWSTLSSTTSVSNQCNKVKCYWSSWFPNNSAFWTTSANWPPSGSATTCTDTQVQSYVNNTIILGPGDYYFTNCQLKNCTVVCDNADLCNDSGTPHPGPVRIWCGGSSSTDDQISCGMTCTNNTDASLAPKCFYSKAGHTCTMSCSNNQKCGVYAVKCGKSGTTTSGCKVVLDNCRNGGTGTVIADQVQINSNTSSLNSANTTHPSDPTAPGGFGFAGNWIEIKAPNAGAVFSDGTNN